MRIQLASLVQALAIHVMYTIHDDLTSSSTITSFHETDSQLETQCATGVGRFLRHRPSTEQQHLVRPNSTVSHRVTGINGTNVKSSVHSMYIRLAPIPTDRREERRGGGRYISGRRLEEGGVRAWRSNFKKSNTVSCHSSHLSCFLKPETEREREREKRVL